MKIFATGTRGIPDIPGGIELICLCANRTISEQDLSRIRYLTTRDPDWSFLKEAFIRNRIWFFAYQHLKSAKENIPQNFLSELKQRVISTATRNIYLTVYLKQILSEFQNHGVFVLPFKGPVLGEQVYKDSMLRPFSDLDILVGPSDAIQAADLLKAKGMTPQMELDVPQFRKYVKDEDHFSFYDTRNKISVELHWDMAGNIWNRSAAYPS